MSRRVVIGLGSNLGDRLRLLEGAAAALQELGERGAVSSVMETPALGPPQPDYLNAALLLWSGQSAPALLEALLRVERRFGRERRERWGPRTLDLDLLWIEGERVDLPGLTVPHPELVQRAFALWPLLEIAPDALDPRTGARLGAARLPPLASPPRRVARPAPGLAGRDRWEPLGGGAEAWIPPFFAD